MENRDNSGSQPGYTQAGKIDLSGKVALVTGGGRGIGATVSLVLAQAGADIVINHSKSPEESERIRGKVEAMGRRAVVIGADVGYSAQCKALAQGATEAFGRVDILVNNAGMGQPNKIVDTSDEEWDRVMNVNARAMFSLARELLPGMMERKFGARGFDFVQHRGVRARRRFIRDLRGIESGDDRTDQGDCARGRPLRHGERDLPGSDEQGFGGRQNEADSNSGG